MKLCDWEKFFCDRWDLSYLRKLLDKHKNDKLILIPIKLQINSIVLLLCMGRIFPQEICDLIRDFTPDHMDYFRPEKYILNKEFRFRYTDNLTFLSEETYLNIKFIHCENDHGLYNLKKVDIKNLRKLLNVGSIGSFRVPHYGYWSYIIIDINDDYKTIKIIEELEDSFVEDVIIPKEGYVTMFTFDDFISYGYDDMENYIRKTKLNKKFEYEIEKIYYKFTGSEYKFTGLEY